jgi:4-amino-4-deoxy-L-arabinose transferase-like glycosyltransferase
LGHACYSGAVRAMTENWTAFFFGSTDAGNTVTVDKPPAALWVSAGPSTT